MGACSFLEIVPSPFTANRIMKENNVLLKTASLLEQKFCKKQLKSRIMAGNNSSGNSSGNFSFGIIFSDDDESDARFLQMVDEAEIERRKEDRVPKNTQYANNSHLNVWKEWADWQNKRPKSTSERYKVVPNIEEKIVSNEELGFWLSRFVLKIRRKDPPNTYGIYVVASRDV